MYKDIRKCLHKSKLLGLQKITSGYLPIATTTYVCYYAHNSKYLQQQQLTCKQFTRNGLINGASRQNERITYITVLLTECRRHCQREREDLPRGA